MGYPDGSIDVLGVNSTDRVEPQLPEPIGGAQELPHSVVHSKEGLVLGYRGGLCFYQNLQLGSFVPLEGRCTAVTKAPLLGEDAVAFSCNRGIYSTNISGSKNPEVHKSFSEPIGHLAANIPMLFSTSSAAVSGLMSEEL